LVPPQKLKQIGQFGGKGTKISQYQPMVAKFFPIEGFKMFKDQTI
jgi:hypothetical protein